MRTISTISTISFLLMIPACREEEPTNLCIYTARSEGQVRRELPSFLAKHSEIRVACPHAPREDVWCESRWKADENSAPVDCAQDPWEVVRKSTDDLLDVLNQQARVGEHHADVIWGLGMSHLLRVITRQGGGIYLKIKPYAPDGLDNLEDEINRRMHENPDSRWYNFLDTTYQQDREIRPIPMWMGIDAFATALCINRHKMENAGIEWPASWTWDELTKEVYKGRLAMPKAYTSGSGFIAAAGVLYLAGGFEADGGWEMLDRIDANVAIYTEKGDGPCDKAADDQLPDIMIGVTYDAADQLVKANPAVERIFPDDGVGYDIAGIALVDKEGAGSAAQDFLDWASQDAMTLYSESTPLIAFPKPPYYPPGYPLPPDKVWLGYEFGALAGARTAIQARWADRYCPGGDGAGKCE